MKVYLNGHSDMTKMATILGAHIYGKNPLKIFLAHDLGFLYVALGMWGLTSLFK